VRRIKLSYLIAAITGLAVTWAVVHFADNSNVLPVSMVYDDEVALPTGTVLTLSEDDIEKYLRGIFQYQDLPDGTNVLRIGTCTNVSVPTATKELTTLAFAAFDSPTGWFGDWYEKERHRQAAKELPREQWETELLRSLLAVPGFRQEFREHMSAAANTVGQSITWTDEKERPR
jgi:hypothetical protein